MQDQTKFGRAINGYYFGNLMKPGITLQRKDINLALSLSVIFSLHGYTGILFVILKSLSEIRVQQNKFSKSSIIFINV